MNVIEGVYQKFVCTRFPLPTEAEVHQLEEQLEIRFPEHYREFLLSYNGGYFDPEPSFQSPATGAPESALTCLYGIAATALTAELARPTSLMQFSDNSPPQIIPIGDSPIHELILLVTDEAGDDFGTLILNNRKYGSFFLAYTMEELFELLDFSAE